MFRISRAARVAIAMLTAFIGAFVGLSGTPAHATSRIKDLANIEGVRQNQLIGYGLVVGLNGTGDDMKKSRFTLIFCSIISTDRCCFMAV